MTIYGAIWYQGESNANAPFTYNCTFPAMIDDWRSKWFYGTDKLTDPEFPFGFVQVGHISLTLGCSEFSVMYHQSGYKYMIKFCA